MFRLAKEFPYMYKLRHLRHLRHPWQDSALIRAPWALKGYVPYIVTVTYDWICQPSIYGVLICVSVYSLFKQFEWRNCVASISLSVVHAWSINKYVINFLIQYYIKHSYTGKSSAIISVNKYRGFHCFSSILLYLMMLCDVSQLVSHHNYPPATWVYIQGRWNTHRPQGLYPGAVNYPRPQGPYPGALTTHRPNGPNPGAVKYPPATGSISRCVNYPPATGSISRGGKLPTGHRVYIQVRCFVRHSLLYYITIRQMKNWSTCVV